MEARLHRAHISNGQPAPSTQILSASRLLHSVCRRYGDANSQLFENEVTQVANSKCPLFHTPLDLSLIRTRVQHSVDRDCLQRTRRDQQSEDQRSEAVFRETAEFGTKTSYCSEPPRNGLQEMRGDNPQREAGALS